MDFVGIAGELRRVAAAGRHLLWPGMALIITGLGFKLALIPFHHAEEQKCSGGSREHQVLHTSF